jgi:hypothetical protein
MLVHMTPREVAGLQSLAMAHGGSLTINPKTGLPEASILGSLLPTLFGVGLNMMFPGLGAIGAGLITGGLTTLASGNLKQGLMAGLGAYGGAGLGESLVNAGATAPAAAAPVSTTTFGDYAYTPPIAAANNAAATTAAAAQPAAATAAPSPWGSLDAGPGATSVAPGSMQPFSSAQTNTLLPPPAVDASGNIVNTPVVENAAPATPSRLEQMGQGVKNVFTDPKTGKQFFKDNWMSLGSAFAAPAMEAMKQQPFLPPAKEAQKFANYGYKSERNPKFGQPGEPYMIQSYTPIDYSTTFRAAEGGMVSPNDNKMYPMSGLASGKAGFNVQSSPTANEVVGGYDARIDPFTGQQMMAAGGAVQHYLAGGAATKAAGIMYGDQAGGGPYSDAAGYGPYSDAAEEGPYTNSDMNKGLEAQFRKMAPSTLARYKKAKNAAMQAAALKEEYARASAVPDYDDTEIKMADGGLLKQLGLELSAPSNQHDLGQGLRGLMAQLQNQGSFGAPQFTYNPDNQTYAQVGGNAPTYIYDQTAQEYKQMAAGGIASLPEYAAGGKLLRGAGDGMSDDIPAVIRGAKPQRAALADGEFVVPADVVSHLGNGSTEAGAKRLYSMMSQVRKARTGNPKQGKQIQAEKYMPA